MGKKLLKLIMLGLLIINLTGCKKEKCQCDTALTNTYVGTNGNANEQHYTSEELEKNIKTSGVVAEDGNLIIFTTNENQVNVDMTFEISFYDADGKIVGSDKEYLRSVGPNSETAIRIWLLPDYYDSYTIYVDAEQSGAKCYIDQIELSHNNNGENVLAQIKNNSQDIIETITVSVVYYKDNQPIGINIDYESDIKPERLANFTFSYPRNKNFKKINFDSYKIFINEVYSY